MQSHDYRAFVALSALLTFVHPPVPPVYILSVILHHCPASFLCSPSPKQLCGRSLLAITVLSHLFRLGSSLVFPAYHNTPPSQNDEVDGSDDACNNSVHRHLRVRPIRGQLDTKAAIDHA